MSIDTRVPQAVKSLDGCHDISVPIEARLWKGIHGSIGFSSSSFPLKNEGALDLFGKQDGF